MNIDPEFQIVIPTHNRVHRQISLSRLPSPLKEAALLVTSLESEAKELRKTHKNTISLEKFGALESHGQRIHTKRQWIIENIESENILQLDDDLYYFHRCAPKYRMLVNKQWKLTPEGAELGKKLLFTASPKAVLRMFESFREDFISKGYVHGGFGSRMGNDKEDEEIDYRGGRIMHAICHNRSFLLENDIRFDEIEFREDFNVTLKLLRIGKPGLRYFKYAVSPDSYQKPGGCATYRTQKASDIAAMKLALLHPGLVALVRKEYTHSVPRIEVKVQWMQALEKEGISNLVNSSVRTEALEEGYYKVKCYSGYPPLIAYCDGKRWNIPSFNKPNLKTNPPRIKSLPFRVKPLSK